MGIRKIIEMLKEADLEKLQENAKKVKFECLKYCGHVCCTQSELIFNPANYEKDKEVLNEILNYFPLSLPWIGQDSNLPFVIKNGMSVCPFYHPEKHCTIHEKKPPACKAFPAVLAFDKDGEKVLFLQGKFPCPEEAFKQGKPLHEHVKINKNPCEGLEELVKPAKELIEKLYPSNVERTAIAYMAIKETARTGNYKEAVINTYTKMLEEKEKSLELYARTIGEELMEMMERSKVSSEEIFLHVMITEEISEETMIYIEYLRRSGDKETPAERKETLLKVLEASK